MEKILIVDDEPGILLLLGNILKGEGYQVVDANNGVQAMEIIKAQSIDLIITDIRMPGMDGVELIRKTRELDKDYQIIVLTGFAAIDDAVEILRNGGAFDYLTKPLEDIEAFLNTVNNAVVQQRLEKEKKSLVEELQKHKKELREKVIQLKQEVEERNRIERSLRKSEQRYRQIVEGTGDLVTRVDSNGKLVYLNSIAEKIFGLKVDDCIGRSVFDFIHPDDRQRTKLEFARWKRKKILSAKIENRQVNQTDKAVYDMMWVCSLQYDNNDKLIGINSIAHDLTEHKKLQEIIIKTRKLESLGTLAGGIAHDFNNIMFVIMGNIELAKEDEKLDNKTLELLQDAEKACQRTRNLTTRLLTFSDGGSPVKKTTSIARVIKDSLDSVLIGDDIEIKLFIPDGVHDVNIDQNQIKQVVQDIVINAQEAMDASGTIKISCENSELTEKNSLGLKPGKYVRIIIEDHGCGISGENLEKVFDPYFSTKSMGINKGQGLGLAVCTSIVEKHAGKITIESEPGIGTSFIVYLPGAAKRIIQDKAGTQSAGARIAGKQSAGVKGKVLVMDDEDMIRNFSLKVLDRLGYDCKSCVEGTAAIELYKNSVRSGRPFDVLLLDLFNQFGMGGKETMETLLKINPGVKGILCSGYSNDPVVNNFKAFGFSEVLHKPYTMDQLSRTLSAVILGE